MTIQQHAPERQPTPSADVASQPDGSIVARTSPEPAALGHLALAHRPSAIADLALDDRPAAFADLDAAIVAELKSIEES